MALQTDLNVFPYYDDYDPTKNYYRVLFKPGVAVQARELNQLQAILQNQIEKFGDNIFKRGTIIEGCNIKPHSIVPYVKIRDTETDGTPVNVSTYNNMFVRNSANLTAYIQTTVEGFESRAPDLNTLFVMYNSAGSDSSTFTFSALDTLEVYDPSYPVAKINVIQGSRNVSNSDAIVVVSAIAVQNSTGGSSFTAGSFNVGDTIQNGVANAVIIEANTTANTKALVLKIKPLSEDLLTANTLLWKFSAGENILNYNTAATAKIADTIGDGADAALSTDSLGKITSITMTAGGSGYYVEPHVTVKKLFASGPLSATNITELDLTAQNYMSTITVANSTVSPIGTGYGISVGEGVIYQKGFFSRVEPQFTIVEKYSNTGFDKAVGFSTDEALVNSDQDQTLLDNATGTYNYAAPGADRLNLSPVLTVLTKAEADANTEFLPIVEFSDGNPYKKNPSTVYNVIGDYIAKRTYEESGNYVLDRFNVVVTDDTPFANTATSVKVVVDPGTAYINGYRVSTGTPFKTSVDKGIDTAVATMNTGVNYGNYVYVDDLAGNFSFNQSSLVKLYSDPVNYISGNKADLAIAGAGTQIGTARVRSIILDSGEPGTATAKYKMYLFDIVMNSGKNFGSVRSIVYDGTNKGVADVVTTNGVAVLQDADKSSMLTYIGKAIKNVSNITYTYRTTDLTATSTSTGYINIALATSGEVFPAIFTSDILVTPRASYQAASADAGTVAVSSGGTTVSGVSSSFTTRFKAGDFVKIANATHQTVAQVASVINNTQLSLNTPASSAVTGGSIRIYFPANIPISLSNHPTGRSVATTDSTHLQIFLGDGIRDTSGNPVTANMAVTFNVNKTITAPQAKSVIRNAHTRLDIYNNNGGVAGPWALGVSDAFRLRKVYKANTASRAESFNASADVNATTDFITITNNAFANGDSVVYASTGGTAIGGLTSGQTYYVVAANSSGLALSTTRGGSRINISAGSSETHTLTGRPLYFAPDSYGVIDVTNDFVIDTNQKEDYLDISYLTKKARTVDLTTNDTLLVEYDAFFGGDIGLKAISSYTIDDTVAYADLDETAINTMEIPEVIGTSGTYYDIRDQYDFRPRSANTISHVADINDTSIVNPSEPTDAARFTSVEMYIPAPRTTVTANVEYYQGRVDKVVLTDTNNIIVRKGVPGTDKEPSEPAGSIALQILKIPPYPSLPTTSFSGDMAAIVDTKVINEAGGRRIKEAKITYGLDKNQIAHIQPKNYKMSDIAKLENRLNALEYYVSFTLAEAMANARFIPSSLDGLTDRFRFGFFVDPFSNYNYADVNNPEFYANIVGDQLVPKLKEFNIEFQTEEEDVGMIIPSFNEYTLLTQADATDGAIVPPDVYGNVEIITVSQETVNVTQRQRTSNKNDNGTVYEDFTYTFSSLSGPAEFYICGRDNYLAVEISQGPTNAGPWATTITSTTAKQITDSDIYAKGLNGLEYGFENRDGISLDRKSSGPLGGWIEDCFKLLWTHDPSLGQFYRVRVYKGGHHGGLFGGQGSRGSFGFKMFYPSDVITRTQQTVKNPATFVYNGIVHSISPAEFTLQLSMPYIDLFGYGYEYGSYGFANWIGDAQKFSISMTGLKPNTYHNFIFDGSDNTSKCKQIRTGTTNTSGLLSDENGVLSFDFYYDAGVDEVTTDLQQANKLMAAAAGVKAFTIETTDGSSKANGVITMKYYTALNLDAMASGLNTSATSTEIATQTAPTVTGGAIAEVAQEVNDAIDRTLVNRYFSRMDIAIP